MGIQKDIQLEIFDADIESGYDDMMTMTIVQITRIVMTMTIVQITRIVMTTTIVQITRI